MTVERPAVRLVAAAQVALDQSDQADTEEIVFPASTFDGCRSCHHDKPAHFDPRAHNGWRERCVCGCESYRSPWAHVVIDLGTWAVVLFLAALVIWLAWGAGT